MEMQSSSMSRSASGRVPETGLGGRHAADREAEERALVAAAMLLTAAGYRVDPMPPAAPRDIEPGAGLPALTARERQVAGLLVEGASNKLIARRLEISVHTAKFHVAAVLEKLHARNRSDAVAIALRDGLVAL